MGNSEPCRFRSVMENGSIWGFSHFLRSILWTISFSVHWIPGRKPPLGWRFSRAFFVWIEKQKQEMRKDVGGNFFFFCCQKKQNREWQKTDFCLENKQLKVGFWNSGWASFIVLSEKKLRQLRWWQVCGHSMGFQRELCAHLSFLLWLRGRKQSF